ncbi:vitamin K epoxide reductase family protein [Candidatus Woesearchaeota archaeon]|nr:vitamin K epoxide reductase family protein [Candidatus Woesearchaeota archaeon]
MFIQVLGVLGLCISLYFTAVYYGYITANKTILPPAVCSRQSCYSVLFTGYARVFRLPNFIWGIGYYSIILYSASSGWMHPALVGLSWFVAAFSLYLMSILLFRLRTTCVLCYAANIINLLIAVYL